MTVSKKKAAKIVIVAFLMSCVRYIYNEDSKLSRFLLSDYEPNSKCLNKTEFEGNIDNYDQVYVIMPAKAGGRSLKTFAEDCSGNAAYFQDQFNSFPQRKQWLSQSYDVPKVLIGHSYNGDAMKSLLKGASEDSLIVYIHREETSRLASAIKHVMWAFCDGSFGRVAPFEFVERNEIDKTCTVAENDLIDKVIQPKVHEIGMGVHEIWSCDTFHTLNNYRPNLVTMNMNQIDTLQTMLAKKFCPQMMDQKQHIGSDQQNFKTFVQLSSNSTRIVALEEWVLKKQNMLEYTLGFNQNIGCQKNVRDLEDELYETCRDDGFVKLSKSPFEDAN